MKFTRDCGGLMYMKIHMRLYVVRKTVVKLAGINGVTR